MSKLYFTQITNSLNYPAVYKATISTMHNDIISYALNGHYNGTNNCKKALVRLLNTISYRIISGDTIPSGWQSDPYNSIEIESETVYTNTLTRYGILIEYDNIIWDIDSSEDDKSNSKIIDISRKPTATTQKIYADTPDRVFKNMISSSTPQSVVTQKEDLYLKPPTVMQIDTKNIWYNTTGNNIIYSTLPAIPTKQREISITTDINKIGEKDLMRLFPTQVIRTRSNTMYEKLTDIDYDDNLGVIFPIADFTVEQIRDNIIKYPHIHKLMRNVNGALISFYSYIELNGKLYNISEVWDSLPDLKKLPKNKDYAKEYIVRRYLLERDILGIEHKYPIYGDLSPFLTLVMPSDTYILYGFSDIINIAKQCINSRIQYKLSRNPVLKQEDAVCKDCIFSAHCTESYCDNSCPIHAETTYLLERNKLSLSNAVFSTSSKEISNALNILHFADGKFKAVVSDNTIYTSDLLTYCGICEHWKGDRLSCNVYHLRFSNYIDSIQKSWGSKENDEMFEYENIWVHGSKLLIISDIDYVQFKDFQSQTLLNLIHSRMSDGLTTVVVTPRLSTLMGDGNSQFFTRLKSIIREAVAKL